MLSIIVYIQTFTRLLISNLEVLLRNTWKTCYLCIYYSSFFLLFKGLGSVRFLMLLKEVSYSHKGSIY